jgi:oligopeptide/dipeptide ABC transporter ATP-binding protein
MISTPILDVEGLSTHLFTEDGIVHAVDNVSLTIGRDETVALVGESGCGKSMTALSIIRLEPSAARILSGSIYFDGKDILTLDGEAFRALRGKRIAMIYQDPMTFLNPILKVGNQVAEVIELHQKADKRKAREKTLDVFGRLGIPSPERVAESYPHQLSGGMRQRILIAMAISCRPDLLIADEPTTALDVSVQAQIMELLREIRTELRNSLLLITHDLGLVAEHSDRVYVMYAGQIVEHADTVTLFGDARHPYTQGLLKSNLSPDRRVARFDTIEGEVPNLLFPPSGCRFHPRCGYRMEVCVDKEPPFFGLSSGHRASCWLFQEGRS